MFAKVTVIPVDTVKKLKSNLLKLATQLVLEVNQSQLEVDCESEVELRHEDKCFKARMYIGKKSFK